MTRFTARWMFAFWIAFAGAAQAQDNPVVVELFTSQGCSSCPPADALLAKLSNREDVIALALHVDYWDYIGWKDKFASPLYTARQKGYASTSGRSRIYTPQMIVNGMHDVVGNRPMDVADLIETHRDRVTPVVLRASRDGNTVLIHVDSSKPVGPSEIHLVRYLPSETVDIRKGENAGKSLTYTQIVSDWTVVGRWNGHSAYDGQAVVSGDAPVVVLVQGAHYGPILAAARLR